MISETIYQGGNINKSSWGGLPIVILVGDDFQLPGCNEGALNALFSTKCGKMTLNGRKALLECAQTVRELKKSIRIQEKQKADLDLMMRLRESDNVTDEDCSKLLSLRLSEIEKKHGSKVVEDIKSKAIHLFYRNEPRIRHNLARLGEVSSATNPVCIICPRSTGGPKNKGVTSHFDDQQLPKAGMFCIGSRVALEGRNFNPSWGLFNGAMGTVDEIIFEKDGNPNRGDLPKYVVVDFPQYCGPIWDINNPKVCSLMNIYDILHIIHKQN